MEKEKTTSKLNVSDSVKETMKLLENESSVDRMILNKLSSHSIHKHITRESGKRLDLEKLDEKFEGGVFNEEQIKKICVSYALRFLPASLFTGAFDV